MFQSQQICRILVRDVAKIKYDIKAAYSISLLNLCLQEFPLPAFQPSGGSIEERLLTPPEEMRMSAVPATTLLLFPRTPEG
jgi:hypothetical protein